MPHRSDITILKANGETEVFNPDRLRGSLRRSGADELTIEEIVDQVLKDLKPGMSTNQIYKTAYHILKQRSRITAPRYSLKRAIMQMGPSGYPFEHLVAELLQIDGYATQVGVIRQGKCVKHEVDVLAMQDHTCIFVECKYHNRPGHISDVKVPLYIHSRFLDLVEGCKTHRHDPMITQGWLVTNTRFSIDAIDYGRCVNLTLIGWDYPDKLSLKARIDTAGLYPITVLTRLSKAEMEYLLNKSIITCSELLKQASILDQLHVPQRRREQILEEADELCSGFSRQNGLVLD